MASKTDVSVNLFDPAVQQCPYAAYKTLRDEAPAYNIPGTEIWVVTRYEDVRRVLTDAEAFPSTSKNTAFRAGDGTLERAAKVASRFAEKGWVPAPTLNGRDDPNHKQMRAMFNEAFKPSRIKEIDSKVESLAYDLIDAFLPDGHCDWVSQFAVPLPLFIIGEQMGAPREDMWQIKRWTDAFFQRISFMLPEDQHLEMVDREIEAQHYFQPIFERLRKNPDESLISVLVNTVIPEWGRPLNDNELHAEMMADTFVGGSETTIDATVANFGRIDILVNNAGGAGDLQPLVNLSDEAFDQAMKWNVYSTFWATRRALKPMLAQKYGRIINISSMEGKHGKPIFTAYTAAKHAINGMTKSLAREVGTEGVTANCICPGLVVTDIIKDNGPAVAATMGMTLDEMIAHFAQEAAIKRPNKVEEIAAVAVLLASEAGAGITGAMFSVDGGTAQY